MNDYPQIRTTLMENVIPVTTVIDAPWVSVTSLNGMTGDVIVEPIVKGFSPNTQYAKDTLISVDGVLYTAKANFTSGSTFDPDNWNAVGGMSEIPIATTSTLGGIKVGSNLSITQDGTLSADNQQAPIATTSTVGVVKVGNNLSITQDGTLSADAQQVTLYNTTGQNTDGAMTQKATTDEFEKVSYIGDTIPGQAPLIETADIADSAITTPKLANNSITSAKIVDGTIATADIADSAITAAKIDWSAFAMTNISTTNTATPSNYLYGGDTYLRLAQNSNGRVFTLTGSIGWWNNSDWSVNKTSIGSGYYGFKTTLRLNYHPTEAKIFPQNAMWWNWVPGGDDAVDGGATGLAGFAIGTDGYIYVGVDTSSSLGSSAWWRIGIKYYGETYFI